MKKIYLLILLMCSLFGFAQKVIQAEYFWDNDPGQGNANVMLAFDGNFNQALESVLANNATLPSVGNHVIGIRIKGDDGTWGTVFRKVFKVASNNNSNNLAKVTQAEYFWDNDLGQGNGNVMLAFDGNFNQALESVLANNATLPNVGNHVIGIRIKGDDGTWGTVFRKVFKVAVNNNSNNLAKITQAEYFWDNDPGQGNSNVMLAFDGNFNQALESVLANNATLPTVGNHVIGIRIKGDDGTWGMVFRKVFKVAANNNSNNVTKITQAEYFWNNDPGEGNGNIMLAFDGNFNQALESVLANNATLPTVGINLLNVRLKADDGNWGKVFSKVIGLDIVFNSQVLLTSPINNASNISLTNNFVWQQLVGAGTYEYHCATDNTFTNIAQSGLITSLTVPFSSLLNNTVYYWRVRANVSGNVSLWSTVWQFTTDVQLSNAEFDFTNEILVTPNPVQTVLNIKTSISIKEIFIFDVLGKKISASKISDKTIDVSNLAKGMYLVKIIGENNKVFSTKFIKE